MRNKVLTLATLLWIAFSFIGCNNEEELIEKVKLTAPELTQTVESDSTFTVSWKTVKNAISYVYDLDGQTNETQDTIVAFSGMEAASSHTIRVKAVADPNSNYLDSEWAETTVQLMEKVDYFEITCDVNGKMVSVQVKPSDKNMTYYTQILSDADYQDYGGEPVKAFQSIINFYKEIFGEGTYDFLKDVGDVNYEMDMDAYGLDGYVLAAGIDENLNITTEVALVPFKTGPLPMSENTFEVELRVIEQAKAVFDITPSNNDPYTMIVMEKDALAGYTDEDIHNLFSNEYKEWIREHLYRGEMSMTYTSGLFPDTEYTLFIFGWDTEPNTEINKFDFRTEKPVDDNTMTFELTAKVLGPNEIYTKVVPSSSKSLYFTDVIKKSDFDKYGADNLIDYYKNICEENPGLSFIEYIEMFASVGEYETTYDYLDANTEYVFMAVALTIEGDKVLFYTPEIYDEILVTPAN